MRVKFLRRRDGIVLLDEHEERLAEPFVSFSFRIDEFLDDFIHGIHGGNVVVPQFLGENCSRMWIPQPRVRPSPLFARFELVDAVTNGLCIFASTFRKVGKNDAC